MLLSATRPLNAFVPGTTLQRLQGARDHRTFRQLAHTHRYNLMPGVENNKDIAVDSSRGGGTRQQDGSHEEVTALHAIAPRPRSGKLRDLPLCTALHRLRTTRQPPETAIPQPNFGS